MILRFKAKTNKDYVAINTALFRTENGGLIEVDRHWTEYTIKDGVLDMTWNECYLHSLDGHHIFSDEIPDDSEDEVRKLLMDSEFVRFEIEEDVDDEDYFVEEGKWLGFVSSECRSDGPDILKDPETVIMHET